MYIAIVMNHAVFYNGSVSTSEYHVYEHIVINRVKKILNESNIYRYELFGITDKEKTTIDIYVDNVKDYEFVLKVLKIKKYEIFFDTIKKKEIVKVLLEIENELIFILSVNGFGKDSQRTIIKQLRKNAESMGRNFLIYSDIVINDSKSLCIKRITSKNITHNNFVEQAILQMEHEESLSQGEFMDYWTDICSAKYDESMYGVFCAIVSENEGNLDVREKLFQFKRFIDFEKKHFVLFCKVEHCPKKKVYKIFILCKIGYVVSIFNDITKHFSDKRRRYKLDIINFKVKIIV